MATKSKRVPRRVAAKESTPGSAPSRNTAPESSHPIDVAVDKFFKNDERVRAAMSRNLKERGAATMEVAARAKAAFKGFSPSKHSSDERARRNFVSAEVSPGDATRAAVEKGVEAIRASAPRRAMKIRLGGGFDKLIEESRGGASIGKVPLGELMTYVQTRIGSGALNAAATSAFTECRAEAEAQRRLDQILGKGADDVPKADVPETADADDLKPLKTDEFVSEQVRTQMQTATSPEQQLHFAVPSRSDPKQTDKAIETFELRSGPADVTSYHDFNSLQIAFEHVWQEIFDGRLAKLGQDLYREYVKLQEFVGKAPDDKSIDTIDDLRNLMDEIRELAKLTNEATPTPLQPKDESGGTNSGGDTTDALVDVVATVFNPASVVTNAIGDETIAAIVNPAGAIIKAIADLIKGLPQLTWASFPGPLPGNGNMISVRVEPNVVPAGTVEILLVTGPKTAGWKGIKFTELDANNKSLSTFWIANDPNDQGVWDRNSFDRLPLYTGQVSRAYLEFWHEGILSVHTACFVMDGLAEKLMDRTRVTFTWTKDR